MRSFIDGCRHPRVADTRIICLPGAYDNAMDFSEAGFSGAVARRGLAIDLEYVDLDLQHLGDRAVLHIGVIDKPIPIGVRGDIGAFERIGVQVVELCEP